MLRWLTFAAMAGCSVLVALAAPWAQERPLLMERKQSLFQRVLVREHTHGADAPGEAGTVPFTPLDALFVYAREGDWLQVGRGDHGQDLSWIPASAAVDWRQNIVLTFEGTENVGRLLFFSDLDGLYGVVESENPARDAAELRAEAEVAEDEERSLSHIVALGPREAVDLRRSLYVMPILETEQALFESGVVVNLLKVAVARADPKGASQADRPAPAAAGERMDFRAAVVFVVDTTTSMQPFIDATRQALEAMFESVSAAQDGDAVSFGLVGFRDNPAVEPPNSYAFRTFAQLQQGPQAERFLAAIREMKEANASNRHFREDSYAGIEHALVDLDWTPYGARYLVLVTDAGPREVGDDLSQTGLSASGLATLVQERLGAAIAVLHLRTQDGASDHASAEAAYRELTRSPNQEPLYFPVDEGDPKAYSEAARRLAGLIVEQVAQFRQGDEPREGFGAAPEDFMAEAIRSASRTMQLAYLGRVEGTRAPDVFEAYVADRDFDRTGLKPLSIRLLLTKGQLSDLEEALRLIIEKAEANVIDPNEFFQQVLGAAADMSRRPEDVAQRGGAPSLAEAAAVAEYLEGLPYVSRIMNITEDDWVRMSIAEQQTVVNELYDKMARYRRYNGATDQWVNYLGSDASAGSLVYPMRLDDLP